MRTFENYDEFNRTMKDCAYLFHADELRGIIAMDDWYEINSVSIFDPHSGEEYILTYKWTRCVMVGSKHVYFTNKMVTLEGYEEDTLRWIYNKICGKPVVIGLLWDRSGYEDVTNGYVIGGEEMIR